MTKCKLSRRNFLEWASGTAAVAVIGAPAVHAQTAVLKTTAWGGKWGEVMKGQSFRPSRRNSNARSRPTRRFPITLSCRRAPKNAPLYDVLHTNTSEQWQAVVEGLVEPKLTRKTSPTSPTFTLTR